MKILENKVELVGNKYYENMVRKCERSARTCYQSKHSKSLEDAEKFLYKLMKINHGLIIGVYTDYFRARDRVTELNRIDNAKFDSDDGYHVFRIKELEIDKDMEYGVEV